MRQHRHSAHAQPHAHGHDHGHDHSHHGGDHDHPHPHHDGDHGRAHRHVSPHPAGHNSAHGARQWQTPHLPDGQVIPAEAGPAEPDLDLVERAFVEAFPAAKDPTSFLRLAGVPFTGKAPDGKTLNLLRVETEATTDIGALTPHFGGASYRYDPLPAKMASQRTTLAFVYFDGAGLVRLPLAAAKALQPPEP